MKLNIHKKIFLSLIAFFTLFTAGMLNSTNAQADTANDIVKMAKKNLHKPYVYGAVGPSAFDCSGFTSYVYKQGGGIALPRTAQSQYRSNKHVAYKNIQKGDLVFFGGNAASISHVGLYVGKGKMIDAQNRGVITENVKAPWWHYVGSAHVSDIDD